MKVLYFLKRKELIQLYKFTLTGGLGIVTNLIIFYILVEYSKLPAIPISIFCYFLSATQNYLTNHYWTFSSITKKSSPNFTTWIKFLAGSCFGLMVNILTLHLTKDIAPHLALSQLLGLVLAFFANYTFSIFFVFNKKKHVA